MNDQRPVRSISEFVFSEASHGERYASRAARVAAPLGLDKLGARVVELPPGKRAWPFHHHHANEELVYVISGRGSWRSGDAIWPVAAGDFIAARAGGPEQAHQMVNDSDAPLIYLIVSSMIAPDIVGYPDSGKIALFAGSPPGGDKAARTLEYIGRLAPPEDYWDDASG
jgi:uncharacterized cupin superfamily protein